jgi:hypothetical protein
MLSYALFEKNGESNAEMRLKRAMRVQKSVTTLDRVLGL